VPSSRNVVCLSATVFTPTVPKSMNSGRITALAPDAEVPIAALGSSGPQRYLRERYRWGLQSYRRRAQR
jgi:hypothetical protein